MKDIYGEGSGRVNPEDRKLYEQQYLEGAKLFENALDKYWRDMKTEELKKKYVSEVSR